MIRSQKIKETFICGSLLSKWMGVFHSWLDCFSIGVWAFIQNINFLSSGVFVYWCPFVIIVKCYNLICVIIMHYTFFKNIKLHQILSQFSAITPVQALDIDIFGRDYSNLNNPIPFLPKMLISNTYTRFIVENRDNIWCNKKEGLFWHCIFKKISFLGFF